MLKNCNPSNEHKFVTKTPDQLEPGCFFPRSLWDEEMKVPGNEVVFHLSTSWSHRLFFEIVAQYHIIHGMLVPLVSSTPHLSLTILT